MGLYTIPIESQMEVFARVYAQSAGITIVPGPCFSTDGQKIFMVFLPDSAPAYERFKSEMFAYHETGHCKFSSMKVIMDRFSIKDAAGRVTGIKDKFLKGLHNSIEDVWIEHAMEKQWTGMARKWTELFPKLVKDKCVKTNDPNLPPAEWMCQLLYLKGREHHLGIQFGYNVPAPVQELFDKRVAKFVPEVANCKSTQEALGIAERVAKEIKDLIDEQEKNEKEQQQKQQGGGQGSGGSGGDAGEETESDSDGSDEQPSDQGDAGDQAGSQTGSGSKDKSKKGSSDQAQGGTDEESEDDSTSGSASGGSDKADPAKPEDKNNTGTGGDGEDKLSDELKEPSQATQEADADRSHRGHRHLQAGSGQPEQVC